MKLHTGVPPAAMPTWAELESKTRLGHVDGSMLPASFGHLMGGYAAGYYGYMWSQVLALDMLSAFERQADESRGRASLPADDSRVGRTAPAAGTGRGLSRSQTQQ